MKNNKFLAIVLAFMLLLVPLTVTASASGLTSIFSDLLSGLFDSDSGSFNLGDLSLDFNTIREKLGPIFANNGIDISKYSNSSLAELIAKIIGSDNPEDVDWSKFLSGGTMSDDLLDAITKYIIAATPTTTEATTTEPTTADPAATTAPSTTVPTTAAPVEVVTTIVYVYQGAQTYVTPSTTAPPEEVYTYSYVEPDTVVVPEITTQTFAPVVVDDEKTTETTGSDGFSVKTVIGIALLVLSLVAVVVVAVILKKNKV